MSSRKYILNKIPSAFWICLGLALLPVGIGLGVLLIKSSNLQVKSDRGMTMTIDTAYKIKRVSNDSEYANSVLLAEISDLKSKIDLIIETDRSTDPVLQGIANELERLQPVANEVENYSNQLSDLVEREITEDRVVAP